MRYRIFHLTGFISSHQNASDIFLENKLMKCCLEQLWKNILPTMFILICSSMITLYVSEMIYQAKLHSTGSEPNQASHPQLAKTQS